MKTIFAALLACTLAACATAEAPPPAGAGNNDGRAKAVTQVTDAATTPLSDLNLVRADIPSALSAAAREPYPLPSAQTCDSLTAAVQELDAVLGPDLDTPPSPDNPGLIERGRGAAGNAAVGALRGAAEGVIPFRGWVRKLTGAERYSREVAAAIAAGTVRRAYLKGLGQAQNCQAPAAPRR